MAVEQQGDTVRVTKAVKAADLVGSLPPSELDPLDVLTAERRADREREDRVR